MGSLRHPVGPLPSSIYWRRRAVVFALLGVLALVIVWVLALGGNGNDGTSADGNGPAESITPGPTDGSSVISEAPGGRDEAGDGGGGAVGGGEDDGGAGDGGGAGAGDGDGDGGAGTGGAEGTAGGGAGVGFGVGSDGVPAGSSMPVCSGGDVELRLRSVQNTYEPDEKPEFELIAVNSGDEDCKLDFGPTAAVLTIADSDDDRIWASDDCPWTTEPILLQVPADGEMSRTYEWDLRPSEPGCATPEPGTAPAGSYLAELTADGLSAARAPFVLEDS